VTFTAEIDDWLVQHEDCAADDVAARRSVVVVFLEELARRLARDGCGLQLSDESLPTYVQRLWTAIQCHVPESPPSGLCLEDIVQRIEAGRLAHRQTDANVLEDVVLAQALELGEAEAAEMFEHKYSGYIQAVAAKTGGPAAVDAVENLAADLILPREVRPARLATYRGRTSLKSWLRTVVVNQAMAFKRDSHEVTGGALPEEPSEMDQIEVAQDRQCEELLRPAFRSAVGAVSAEDRVLLKMLLLDGVPQNQLAESLGIAPGTLTRRKQRAAEGIWAKIREFGNRSARPQAVHDCLERTIACESRELQLRLADMLAGEIVRDESTDCEEAD